ncbi:TPA: helix-turn-helix transcriptional regulator [Serratia marcescens]|jgi:putative transcriptional regulator|uniref:helix-turn-helix domain-containing protein n=1 Tax=Serratia sp. CMO1 TaxID=2785630 RepID=UPI0018D7D4D9|nr:helix-turn-helix transcriptional regulator [Serratia sp. CMO1]MBH3205067.1 helix-turn-helix transcriptional regulator [Serratia marcescens]MBN5417381.1 helix-turn-helix transcriptional regulator [Serratia marcescens]QPI32408.1 helix-turn-helix transcriptional regulator [Serratia sp. CMO1]HEJ9067376.1 helix-turn-helix transcriptional regulator [Serratia marcescens]HEJ9108178.1 helix-turn-helix transcriptional regulator [Serratia marcescens]
MIRCHLARLMGERKMKISDVLRETGLSRNTVALMYKETAQKIDIEALEKLCRLFECEVSGMLEIVDDQH